MSWKVDETPTQTPLGGQSMLTPKRAVTFDLRAGICNLALELIGARPPDITSEVIRRVRAAAEDAARESSEGQRLARIQGQRDDAQRDADLASAEVAELDARRRRLVMLAGDGLADDLITLDEERSSAQDRHVAALEGAVKLAELLVAVQPSLDDLKRDAAETACKREAALLIARRQEVLLLLGEAASHLLDELLAIDMAIPQFQQRAQIAALAESIAPKPKRTEARRQLLGI